MMDAYLGLVRGARFLVNQICEPALGMKSKETVMDSAMEVKVVSNRSLSLKVGLEGKK